MKRFLGLFFIFSATVSLAALIGPTGLISSNGGLGGGLTGGDTISSSTYTPAITFDTFVATNPATGGTAPNTMPITIGNGRNELLVVECANQSFTMSSVKVAGSPMNQTITASNPYNYNIWTATGVPSGVQTISMTSSGGTLSHTPCVAISWLGVSQTSPVDFSTGTINYPDGGNSSATLTTSALGDVMMDILADGNTDSPVTNITGQVSLGTFALSGEVVSFSTGTTTGIGTNKMAWKSIGGTPHGTTAVAITPSPTP